MATAAIGLALTGLGALGGLFPRKQISDTTSSSTTTPNYDPQNLALRNQLLDLYQKRTSGEGAAAFQNSYTMGGLSNLRRTAATNQQSVSDMLTARGIGRTTAGGSALADTSYRSGGDFASFLNNIPMIMDQRQAANLAAAGGYQASLPVGSTTSGSSHTVGSVSGGIPGALYGGSSALGGYLGAISAQQAFANALKGVGSPGSGMNTNVGG